MSVRIRQSLGRLRRADEGFTMIVTILTLLIASLMVAAALTAANDDVHLTRNDLNQKEAYEAARAGISDYQFHLNSDVNYWSYCTNPPPTNPPEPIALNQVGSTANRRTVPGAPYESYAIELLPATGQTQCDPNNPVTTMIEPTGTSAQAGTFRIRSDGFAGNVERSIVATFKRESFLNYVYYTEYETLDPSAYQSPSDRAAAATQCDKYWRAGRQPPGPGGSNPDYCVQIFWGPNDVVNGPFHTEDELAICGDGWSGPVFGRGPQDPIEVVAPPTRGDPGYTTQGTQGCSNNPTFRGQFRAGAKSVQPPPTNAQLKQIATSQYQWTGQTHIVLNGNTMTVTNNGKTTPGIPFPSNGVVYVSSSSCSTVYSPFNVTYTQAAPNWAYSGGSGCGTVTVDGTYNQSLTIASDNDLVIDGNITRGGGSALLGLIAQNFVRIYNPCGQGLTPGSMTNPLITAAMLSLTGSFIVDNYDCGVQLGNLNVTGAIAQIYRGPVGLIGSSGYNKNYVYDDNLRAEEPPHFLEPIQAAWDTVRETECNGSGCT